MCIFHFATKLCIYDHVRASIFLSFSHSPHRSPVSHAQRTHICLWIFQVGSIFLLNRTEANNNCNGTCLELPKCKTLLPLPIRVYNLVIIKAMQFVRLLCKCFNFFPRSFHCQFSISNGAITTATHTHRNEWPHACKQYGRTRCIACACRVCKFCNWQTVNGVIDGDGGVVVAVVTRLWWMQCNTTQFHLLFRFVCACVREPLIAYAI